MKVDGTNVKGPARTYRTGSARQTGQKGAARRDGASQADRVDVSMKAKTVSSLKVKMQQAPAVRMDLVEKLKAQIDAGEYSVEPTRVAEKMLRSRVFDE